MTPVPSSRPRGTAKPTDDFDWPPTADELAVYELGPDPWQKLHDASSQVFVARRRESSPTRRTQVVERAPQPTRTYWTRTRAVVLAASAIVAAAAGWLLYTAMTRPLPVHAVHHAAPAAAVMAPPPPITIVATYPVEPNPSRTSLVDRDAVFSGNGAVPPQPAVSGAAPRGAMDPDRSGTAAGATGEIPPDPEPASQITPLEASAAADTMAAPSETPAPAAVPAAVDPGAKTPDAGGVVRDVPGTGPRPR